jgi:integrase
VRYPRKTLTEKFIKSRKAAAAGKRDEYPDVIVPAMELRVTDRAHKSFALLARYPSNPAHPTRRSLGDVGEIPLGKAREKARKWVELIGEGKDPRVEEAREKAATQRAQNTTFAAVADAFLERHAKGLKKAAEAERIIRGEFVKRWGWRPITDIEPEEVAAAIRAIVKRGAAYQAHNALGYVRRLFSWAIGTHEFGIRTSPVEQLKPKDLIGAREARERTLSNDELRAVWKAAGEMGQPYGPLIKLLILTGQREREIADMSWPEVNLDEGLLIIPSRRMKGGAVHEVPLSETAVAMLRSLPRHSGGDFVFSTTAGIKPVNGFSKAKARIDKLSGVADWKFHDLRRSTRTHFSALPVEDMVRELVIAHARPGLHKVYDQHSYIHEKRRCLELWERRLLAIVDPPPPSVTVLDAARERRAATS